MMQDIRELWENWDAMEVSERMARIMTLKDAPQGLNAMTKTCIDNTYPEYLASAEAVIAEILCTSSSA